MALANELNSPEGGPSLAYNLAYGRLLIYQNNFKAAIECLQSIVKVNCQVHIIILLHNYYIHMHVMFDVYRNVMHILCWAMPTIGLGTLRRQNSVLRGQFPLWTTALTFSLCTLPLLTYT